MSGGPDELLFVKTGIALGYCIAMRKSIEAHGCSVGTLGLGSSNGRYIGNSGLRH